MRRWQGLLPLLALLGAGLACGGAATSETPDAGVVATVVAATQAAQLAPPPTATGPASPLPDTPAPGEPIPPLEDRPLRLVYTSDQDAWTADESGTPRRLTSTGDVFDVRLSNDGQLVVYVRRPATDGPSELWAIGSDGSNPRLVMAGSAWNDLYDRGAFLFNDLGRLAFLPGTHHLLMNTIAVPEGPGSFAYDDLLRLDADTGALEQLLPPGEGGGFLPSPDGRLLALIRPTSLGLADSTGSNIRQDCLTFPSIITYSEYLYYPRPVWSADSTRLGLALPSYDPLAPDLSGTVWELRADTCTAEARGTLSGDFFFSQFYAPSLSRDLALVAFARPQAGDSGVDLITAFVDGTGQEIYASGNLSWEGWGPDSEHFMVTDWTAGELRLGARGQAPVSLPDGRDVRWTSETDYLYLSRTEGGWAILRGSLESPPSILVEAGGETVSYDFAGG